jgi:hypothetical protein
MNANWYSEVPVVTRTYMTMAFMTTLACSLDIITPLSLYLNTNLIYSKYQVCVCVCAKDAATDCPLPSSCWPGLAALLLAG